jgi:flavin-dependent dehydrogenase
VQCRFLVDATGRSAAIACAQGVKRVRLDRQLALVGEFLRGENDAAATTLVEAVENGWWYSSPLPGGRRIVAFLTDGDLFPKNANWQNMLRETRHISALVAGCKFPEKQVASPAGTSHLDHLHGCGWLAAGDAAIAWDPLSSQGICTAILMGGRVAGAIFDLLDGRGDGSVKKWEADYRELLRSHCKERRDIARSEQRWPESPFWTRRQRDVDDTNRASGENDFRGEVF